jgi:hypothetical protein
MTNPYAGSGVDTEAGDLAVSLMKKAVSATHNKNVFGSLGGFAGAMDVSFLKNFQHIKNRAIILISVDLSLASFHPILIKHLAMRAFQLMTISFALEMQQHLVHRFPIADSDHLYAIFRA